MSKASKNTSHRKLYTVGSDAPFQFVEAYKSLRTNLEFLSSAGNCKTILITSSVPEEGKSNVALNLAMTLTASGNRVVLVDCDLRKATISRYLRIPRNHAGLTNVITSKDEGALAAALVRVKDSGITVLTAGTIPPNPTELLSTPMTEKIFASLPKCPCCKEEPKAVEETAAEEAPAEEPAKEVPAEAPAEEAPVEEAPAEEPAANEPVAEEADFAE